MAVAVTVAYGGIPEMLTSTPCTIQAALPPFLFRDLTKHLSSSQLERRDIPQCGHFVQLEQPALLIQALEEWITRWNLVEGDKNRDGKL